MAAHVVLEVKELQAGYDGLSIVKGVSLQVHERRSVALLGRNGSGKSTLLKAIFGSPEVNVISGSVAFRSEDVTRWPCNRRLARSMIYLPQGMDVFPRLTVQENLLQFGQEIDWVDEKSFLQETYLLFPFLNEKRRVQAGKLSGGERRAVALSRVLVTRPMLALLDEPTAGLSPSAVEDVSRWISRMTAKGTTIVLVEQNMDLAVRLVTECLVIRNGQIAGPFAAEAHEEWRSELAWVFGPGPKRSSWPNIDEDGL